MFDKFLSCNLTIIRRGWNVSAKNHLSVSRCLMPSTGRHNSRGFFSVDQTIAKLYRPIAEHVLSTNHLDCKNSLYYWIWPFSLFYFGLLMISFRILLFLGWTICAEEYLKFISENFLTLIKTIIFSKEFCKFWILPTHPNSVEK